MSNLDYSRSAFLAVLITRNLDSAVSPYRIAMYVRTLIKASRTAVSLELRRCNDRMTEESENRLVNRLAKLQAKLTMELHEMAPNNMYVRLGGDPRGPCAWLHVPGERGDSFGEGFAIWRD